MPGPQIPTYHLAPNFSITPAPGGPIELGSIIKSLQSAAVLNNKGPVVIPQAKIYCHHKHGFSSTRSKMRKGEYGVWAKMVGFEGIGGELSLAHEKTEEDVYRFVREDTIYFEPTPEYLRESMKDPDVADWIEGSSYKPVYMVTGLKIARDPSISTKRNRKWQFTGEVGVQVPQVVAEVGPKTSSSLEEGMDVGWEHSDDFVVGIRLTKLVYRNAWLRSRHGELVALEHNRGARLVDASSEDDDSGDVLELELDNELNDRDEVLEFDDGIQTSWTVPKLEAGA